MAGDQIVERWVLRDRLGELQQLGRAPDQSGLRRRRSGGGPSWVRNLGALAPVSLGVLCHAVAPALAGGWHPRRDAGPDPRAGPRTPDDAAAVGAALIMISRMTSRVMITRSDKEPHCLTGVSTRKTLEHSGCSAVIAVVKNIPVGRTTARATDGVRFLAEPRDAAPRFRSRCPPWLCGESCRQRHEAVREQQSCKRVAMSRH
jgi:hypothetical protein